MPYLLVKIPDAPAQVVEIDSDPFTIGKRSSSNLVLEETAASRDHCRIVGGPGGKCFLRDQGSRNGTFVGDHRVQADLLLRDGMQARIGESTLTFLLKPPAPGPEETVVAEAPASPPPQDESTPPPAAEAPGRSGWENKQSTPVELKRRIHAALLDRLDLKHEDFDSQSAEEIRGKAEGVIEAVVRELAEDVPDGLRPEDIVREIADEALALGPLEELLADPEVDEIIVNAWDKVYVERHGRIQKTKLRFTDNSQVVNIIRRICSPIGRRIDESSPMVDARLPDGSRVNAIITPLSIRGPSLTIRKFAAEPFVIANMVAFNTLTADMAEFLQLAVHNRRNIMISGGTGSGKTTFLNVVSSFIGDGERIITIEDAAELNLPQEHVVSLEAKAPNIRGEGAIPIRKLVINSLRMRPDRIIVGECRGGEALDMLQAMNTGHDGSLTTLHANSPRDSLRRLETMVLMAGMELPSRAVREQIASAINLIVHTARLSDGTRKVTQIDEITGMEGETIVMQTLFAFRQRGFDEHGNIQGYFTATGAAPEFVHELRERGIEVNSAIFEPAPEEKQARAAKAP